MNYAGATLVLLATFVGFSGTNQDEQLGVGWKTCTTPVCQKRSRLILSSIDTTVDPCDNFYNFTCGNWIKHHEIPDDKFATGIFEIASFNMSTRVKEIFESRCQKSGIPNATDKVLMAFQACTREALSDEEEVTEMKAFLRKVGIGEWPEWPESPWTMPWDAVLARMVQRLSDTGIFDISVHSDPVNATNYVLAIVPEILKSDSHYLSNTSSPEKAPLVAAYKTAMKKTIRLFRPELSDIDVDAIANDIFDFKARIGTVAVTHATSWAELFAESPVMTIEELEEGMPEVRWLQVLNLVFSKANVVLTRDDKVVVPFAGFLKMVLGIVNVTKRSTVRNYLAWGALRHIGAMGSRRIREYFFEFAKLVHGITKMPEMWEFCLSAVTRVANAAVSRIYVDGGIAPQIRGELTEIVESLRNQFSKSLNNQTWMDERTKSYADLKLKKMQINLLYPDWVLNDSVLNDFYKSVTDVDAKTPFLRFYTSFLENHILMSIGALDRLKNRSVVFPAETTEVNAFYSAMDNSITIPAGILQAPLYEYGLPAYINLAAIGFVVGHEITHAFDSMGMKFDASGNMLEWWTNSAKQKFFKKKKCFIDQYNITDPKTGLKLNPDITKGEDISDNGAARRTYEIFKEAKMSSPNWEVLPGLEGFTIDQVYFIAQGMSWCYKTRTERAKELIKSDPHSPRKYRVNMPLGNLPEFSEAFNCPVGTPMNFKRKCVLW